MLAPRLLVLLKQNNYDPCKKNLFPAKADVESKIIKQQ
ncbi:MAG: hypothetical protein JWR61_2319 [Ferruginibacter sp.]|nr:hypothetical protein [Ferruginibacter sp.]